MNILDKAIAWFSPQWAYERQAWRNGLSNTYKAGKNNNSSLGWLPTNGKAEQVNTPARSIIRAKARDMERNSDILGSILIAFENNVVGTGFTLRMKTEDEKLNNQAKEVDDLDETLITKPGQYTIINGVEVNENQKPMAYHLLSTSPDGWTLPQSKRIEANRVIALWQKELPSQIREMPPLAKAIERVNDMEEYMDTISIKEKILACISAFIKRDLPMGAVGRSMNQNPPEGKDYDPATGYTRSRISPGMIMELQPGDDVASVIPAGQASNTKEMVSQYIRAIGSGQGLSYEATSRDMSQVNYSSARQGLITDTQLYKRLQRFMINHMLNDVFEAFLDSLVLAGTVKIKDYWENREEYINACAWSMPGQPWIDPLKEANANRIALKTGQDTLANICANKGLDWKDVMEQRAAELAYIKKLEAEYGIKMEGGNNNATATGQQESSNSTNAVES